MKRKKIIKKTAIIIVLIGIPLSVGIGLYMYNLPHRDIQSAKTDYYLTAVQIVSEYLNDADAANKKYLAADGNSKILEISGVVSKISEDYNGNKVVLLREVNDKAGVSATFTPESNKNLEDIDIGQIITVKGVIRSGASYNEDLALYENVILEKSDIVK